LNAPLRILVVDDNRDAADGLAHLLVLWGHSVRVAYDGQAGLHAAASFKPQIVLLDIGMPMMHGGTVARQLRQLPELKSAIIVAITANDSDDPRFDEWRNYFNSFAQKPYSAGTLEAAIAPTLNVA
jgi:CheY-like chemotaxis protein